jgi:hypothetical protein
VVSRLLLFETGVFVFSELKVNPTRMAGSDVDHKSGVIEFTGSGHRGDKDWPAFAGTPPELGRFLDRDAT